jgi:phage-related protein
MSTRSLGNVVVAIKAVDQASSVMDKIRASTSLLGSTFQSMGGAIGSVGDVMQGFAAGGVAGAAAAAIGEVAQGLKWAVGEASEAEQAIKNLSVAVEKSGTAWDSVKEGTTAALSQLQKFTVYSDEQLAGALERLLSFGMSYEDAMKALGSAVDFAAAKHMDLEGAATIVGKAMDGNAAILKRYGINVTTAKDATAALKAATETVTASLEANKGSLDEFKDSLGDMGIKVNDSAGKMRALKDIAKDLIDSLAAGKIDTETYGQTLADLGIDVETLKLSAADADDVIAALNTQFGGTAQEQAKTYAGIQERLKNATSDLGEKIGTLVLPALAGMTEAMIPIVDWLGKGIDAVQAWLTEVAKMPEVKATLDAVGEAWQALGQWFDSAGKTIQEVLGPSLEELWSALGEVWDALKPVFDAFKELWDAIVGSAGDFDLFKALVTSIAIQIRAVVEVIQFLIPIIREFAAAFKAAADFITPILSQISGAIGGFLKTLHDAFQGFYDWFVGGSMWQDMWNAVIEILSAGVRVILSIISTDLLGGAIGLLTDLGSKVQGLWTAAWTGLEAAFTSLTAGIQATVSGVFEPLGAYIAEMFSAWSQWASDALVKVEGAITSSAANLSAWLATFIGSVYKAWVDFGAAMSNYMNAVVNTIIGIVKGAAVNVQGVLNGMIDAARAAANIIGGILSQIWASIQSTVNQAAQAAGTAGSAITNAFTTAWNTVANAATSFYNWLVGGSLWPDLMDALVTQTEAGMDEMKAAFASGLGDVMINAPAAPSPSAAASSSASAPSASELFSATLPVTVQIDGTTVSRVIERRLISNRQLSAWRSA